MQKTSPIVRAIDVGYGHVKWTDGRDADGVILAEVFPSQAPFAVAGEFTSEIMQRRDTHFVTVNGRTYEVGRDVRLAIGKNQELEQLDDRFALSDGYAARLYGALSYMLPHLPNRTIDYLMLGLPLTTLRQHSDALTERFLGQNVLNEKGDTVKVSHCAVYPQPLGAYAAYLKQPVLRHKHAPFALLVDVGYNTVDWMTCEGMVANPTQASAVERGMNAYLREVAKSVINASVLSASESSVVRRLDQSLIKETAFRIAGKEVDLTQHLKAGTGDTESSFLDE